MQNFVIPAQVGIYTFSKDKRYAVIWHFIQLVTVLGLSRIFEYREEIQARHPAVKPQETTH